MGEIALTIYTKPECGLCDEMKEVVASLPKELHVTLREIDITVDPELENKYLLDIPLLFYGDRCIVKHRTDKKELVNEIGKLTDVSAAPRAAAKALRPRGH